jgi:hypothetical protein
MCGVHDRTVGVGDADRTSSRAFVDDGRGDCAEMGRATGVGDTERVRWDISSGGGTYVSGR